MNKFRSTILGDSGGSSTTPLVREKNGGKGQGGGLTAIEVSRDAARTADHRDSDRHRLARETASIGYKGKVSTVDLINLSGGGAMIEADISPRLWDRIDLYLGEGSPIECAVRWLRKKRIGLEFAHETRLECDPDQRDCVLTEVLRRSFPDLIPTAQPLAEETAETAPATTEVAEPSRRSELRHPLIWNGTILWRHDEHKVRLRNISASGVLVDVKIDLPEGTELMLDLGESGQFFATVNWARRGQAGLTFNQPFDLSVLAAARPDVTAQSWDRPTYLNLPVNQSSPWASEWGRRPLSDLASDLEGFLKR
ncbi:MAG: PilZ domain-containing protein [Sphingomicrobium sp.]